MCCCTKRRNMLGNRALMRGILGYNVTELEKESKAEDTHSMCYRIASSDDCLGTNRVVNMVVQKAWGRPDEGQTPVLPVHKPCIQKLKCQTPRPKHSQKNAIGYTRLCEPPPILHTLGLTRFLAVNQYFYMAAECPYHYATLQIAATPIRLLGFMSSRQCRPMMYAATGSSCPEY